MLDLKDAYFSVPLYKKSQTFDRFQWDGKLYELFASVSVLILHDEYLRN